MVRVAVPSSNWLVAAPLLSQITARDLYAHATTAMGIGAHSRTSIPGLA